MVRVNGENLYQKDIIQYVFYYIYIISFILVQMIS